MGAHRAQLHGNYKIQRQNTYGYEHDTTVTSYMIGIETKMVWMLYLTSHQ